MFPIGNPPSRGRHRIFNAANLRGLPREHVITREGNLDHMSEGLFAAGAAQADAHEFRRTDGGGDLEFFLGGRNYKVRRIPPRPVPKDG